MIDGWGSGAWTKLHPAKHDRDPRNKITFTTRAALPSHTSGRLPCNYTSPQLPIGNRTFMFIDRTSRAAGSRGRTNPNQEREFGLARIHGRDLRP